AAAEHLLRTGAVSRIDMDESEKKREKKKRGAKKPAEQEEEPVVDEVPSAPLGSNECRVDIIGRCNHMGHGVGFTLRLSEVSTSSRTFVFTAGKTLTVADWHAQLLEACKAGGSRVMLGRMNPAIAPDPPDIQETKSKMDEVKEEEDDWLASVMGRCMVDTKDKRGTAAEPSEAGDGKEAASRDAAEAAPKANLPPWLRGRRG
ncbi:unnamed protein product, partial [Polarella glacialis]